MDLKWAPQTPSSRFMLKESPSLVVNELSKSTGRKSIKSPGPTLHNFHSRLNSTAVTLKSLILFLFYFKNSSCLGKEDSQFCLVYGNVF